jgi:hypothetical protein
MRTSSKVRKQVARTPKKRQAVDANKALAILALGVVRIAMHQLDRDARRDLDKAFARIDKMFPEGVPWPPARRRTRRSR